MRIGAGSAIVDAGRVFSQGGLQQSSDPLSVALDGPGFFQVKRGDGSLALTRSGDFHSDANGQLVTGEGDRVWPPVNLPAGTNLDDVSISSTGAVAVKQTVVGQIQVMSVPSPSNLLPVGGSLFLPTTASGGARQMADPGHSPGIPRGVQRRPRERDGERDRRAAQLPVDSKAIQTQDQLLQIANGIRR